MNTLKNIGFWVMVPSIFLMFCIAVPFIFLMFCIAIIFEKEEEYDPYSGDKG